jgi:hypothetical protein
MQSLLIYDIPDDRARQKVADACLDYGLERIQYSAFLGELTAPISARCSWRSKSGWGARPATCSSSRSMPKAGADGA